MQLQQFIQVAARKLINTGQEIKSHNWHGVKLDSPMFEAIKVYLGPAKMPETKLELQNELKPNLPWAEAHFKERVSGLPLNPGETYKDWPFYKRDKEMRTEGEKFTHTYMERFWPKYTTENQKTNMGIRFEYGDLLDVVKQMIKDPYTRQAFLPVFFPEDTGATHGGRVPCTLGYLFQFRGGYLHVTYYMRSCDFLRHFIDDVYLAVRLTQWMCDSLVLGGDINIFSDIKPGLIDMHIGSLHIFLHEKKMVTKKYNL